MMDDAEDLTLPQRPRRPELRPEARVAARPAPQEDLADEVAQDRELTLSTGTVLALFFGLALLCAIFFGFGYSMGHKSGPAAVADATTPAGTGDAAQPSAADVAASKPAAGSPAIQAIPGYLSQSQADAANRTASTQPYKAVTSAKSSGNATSVTIPVESAPTKPKKAPVDDVDGRIVEAAPRPVAVTARTTPALTPSVSAPSAKTTTAPVQTMNAGTPVATGGSMYVQIAAVSHKEDADVLLSALKRRGYSVFTRSSDADKLIHVQVGPFADKKTADAMRQKLLGDGYNAILK